MITKDKFRVAYLFGGLGLGAIAGLMFAPGAVEEMWKYLRERSRRGLDTLLKRGNVRESADVMVNKRKDFIGPPPDPAKNTQETERQAYEEQRRENPGG